MDLESTRVFVKVVQQGSFSKAAAILKHPTSTMSRIVSRLEKEIGTQLLLRTTRRITLTPAGRELYERVAGHIEAIEEARRSVEGNDRSLKGRIRITATEDLGAFVVTPIIGRIIKKYPDLSFDIYYTNEVLDLVKEGYDLALRIGHLNPSRFKSVRLGQLSLVSVASPGYLESRNKIKRPKDLAEHNCLIFGSSSDVTKWSLHSKNEKIKVSIRPHSTANQMQSLVTLAAAQAGIAFVPYFACKREIREGSLVRVLPDWSIANYEVHLVSPNISGMPTRVKKVAEEIAGSTKSILSED
jgi:LysR family transcriptional regulator, regulator for bpeEF and oprC